MNIKEIIGPSLELEQSSYIRKFENPVNEGTWFGKTLSFLKQQLHQNSNIEEKSLQLGI